MGLTMKSESDILSEVEGAYNQAGKDYGAVSGQAKRYYHAIINHNMTFWKDNRICEDLEFVMSFESSQPRSLLIVAALVYRPNGNTSDQKEKADKFRDILQLVQSQMLRGFVLGTLGDNRVNRLCTETATRLLQDDIEEAKAVLKTGTGEGKKDKGADVFKARLGELVVPIQRDQRKRSIVRNVMFHLARKELDSKSIRLADLQVEHILPMNCDKGCTQKDHAERCRNDYWPDFLKENDAGENKSTSHDEYVNRLGNMVLLTGAINERLGAACWEHKRTAYSATANIKAEYCGPLISCYIQRGHDWTQKDIIERQKLLAEEIVRYW